MTIKNKISLLMLLAMVACFSLTTNVFADGIFSVSPMNQKITLNPGERYYGTFKVTNPELSTYNFYYTTDISPFHVDENYDIIYENNGDYNQIVDWITIENPKGVIYPNKTEIVRFYIDVPENAPAGGQYAAINVSSDASTAAKEGGINIEAHYAISHILYAEVAGETTRGGEFNSISVPSFLFSGQIFGTSTITNTGNVHSDASYTLQVFPLFSDEEVYTNEETPDALTILPQASRTNIIYWKETPAIGIFHVIYEAAFEGVEHNVDKLVIVCPLWLLLLIFLAIALIVIRIVTGKRNKEKR